MQVLAFTKTCLLLCRYKCNDTHSIAEDYLPSVQSRARHCAIDPLSEQLAQGRSPLGPNWRSANLTRYENMQRFSANFRSISVF